MAKEVYTRSVKIGGRTYERLVAMKRRSGVPITRLIDKALEIMEEEEARVDELRRRDREGE